MRFSFLAVKFAAALIALTSFAVFNVQPSYSYEKVSGLELKTQVNKLLESKGFMGDPEINEDRFFKACRSQVVIEPLFGSFKTVSLVCSDPDGFKLAVRTNATRNDPIAQKSDLLNRGPVDDTPKPKVVFQNVVSLAKSVSRGTILSDRDVKLIRVKNDSTSGHFFSEADVIGRKTRRPLSVGSLVLSKHLEPEWDIVENQQVIIESKIGPLVVSGFGTALKNGQIGELLIVKSQASGALVEGKIVSEKKVNVIAK